MIEITRTGKCAVITLNNPEKRNALHPVMVNSLIVSLSELLSDDTVSVLVLTGSGKAFCSGADINHLIALQDAGYSANLKDAELLTSLFKLLYYSEKPTIAAVNGPAIAGGCGLALACDFVIADEQFARFGFPEVQIGFSPAIVSVIAMMKLGQGVASRMLISGEIIDAAEAFRLGVCSQLTKDVISLAIELGAKLSVNSVWNMKQTKNLITGISENAVNAAFDRATALNALSRTTDEFRAGIQTIINRKSK